MKKTFLILAIILFGLTAYANEVKINKNFHSFEKLDSIKSIINRDNVFINVNLPKYKDKIFMYDSLKKTIFDNCIKYECMMFDFNSEEVIGMSVLFYSDGGKYITLKNLKESGVTKYKLN